MRPGPSDPHALIEAELEGLRDATRAAHEAVQALKDARRDATAALEMARADIRARIEKEVAAGLADYRTALDKAIADATEATFKRFDTIADILMGEARGQRRAGDVPMTEYARRVAEAREATDDNAGS